MLIVKPDGTLTVTYIKSVPAVVASESAPAPSTLSKRLTQLDAAREAGLISSEEHAEKRSQIPAAL